MTVNTRKKNSRQRGSKTHGGGAMKKRRGAGHRGGRGAAGSGKRGDAKKPSIWGNVLYAGKHGFTSHSTTVSVSITIKYLEDHYKTLLAKGIIVEQKGGVNVNLEKSGYTKLLGTGIPTKKWSITVATATTGAIEKIKNAGGSVIIIGQKSTEDSDEA